MKIDTNQEMPIFMQIAKQLEDAIFTGIYKEEDKIPSTNELSLLLNINPHTVLKGMNLLVEENIIYKKRGLGMYVKQGAFDKIQKKRKDQFFTSYIKTLLLEAKKLGMSKQQIQQEIERGYEDENN